MPVRPQHPAHHEVAVGGGGDQDVLELAAPRRDVVGPDPQARDGPGEHGQSPLDLAQVQWAAAQVHTAPVGAQDAQHGGRRRPADHHLRLVAEAAGRARDGVEPDAIGHPGAGEDGGDARVFAGELVGERQVLVRAGAAGAGSVQRAEGGRRRLGAGSGAHGDIVRGSDRLRGTRGAAVVWRVGLLGRPGAGRVQICHKGAPDRDRPRRKARNINVSLPAFRRDRGLCGRFGQPAPSRAPRRGRPAGGRWSADGQPAAPGRSDDRMHRIECRFRRSRVSFPPVSATRAVRAVRAMGAGECGPRVRDRRPGPAGHRRRGARPPDSHAR